MECVDWQAFTETAVYNIRVSILSSLQQSPKIKQSHSDSGCAPGSMICFAICSSNVWCCSWGLRGMISIKFRWFCKLGSYCLRVLFKLIVADNRFSMETSRTLRAALSETGLEQGSASLTETEREEEQKVVLLQRTMAVYIYS